MKRCLILATALTVAAAQRAAQAAPAYNGMSYTSFGTNALSTPGSDQSLYTMSLLGTDTVALNFWWFQPDITSSSIAENFSKYSSTQASIEHAIDEIHSLGMKVFLKPMLDVNDGTWRANINPADPNAWFASYGSFINTFADMAEAKGVELYSIGCELNKMEDPSNTARWTNLIADVRNRYSGPLTYSANWNNGGIGGGYDILPWWNQLDMIGIDAYFPLTNSNAPTQAQLDAAWTAQANALQTWRNNNHPTQQIIFTEAGYASYDGANKTPYASPTNSTTPPVDEAEQAMAYQALMTAMNQKPWFDGVFWWNWETSPIAGATGQMNGYTPQNKQVQQVLANFYGGVVPPPPEDRWNRNTAGTFSTSSNWDQGAAPTTKLTAVFDRGTTISYAVSFSANATMDRLRIGSNAVTFQSSSGTARTLTIDSTYTDPSNRGIILGTASGNVGSLTFASTISTITTPAATIGDAAGSTATMTLNAPSTVLNLTGLSNSDDELIVGRAGTGTLNILGGAKVNVVVMAQSGSSAVIGKEAGSVGAVAITGAGSMLSLNGPLTVGLGGQASLVVATGGTASIHTLDIGAQGVLAGDGTVYSQLISNGGTVSPGQSPGTLTIGGPYAQTATGKLLIEIAAGGNDKLKGLGTMALDGLMSVSLLGGFVPAGGATFDVLDFTSLTGQFAQVELPSLPGLLRWNQSQLYVDGSLQVMELPFYEGDFNEDGIVDGLDLERLEMNFDMAGPATHQDGDANGDTIVDGADLAMWQRQLGSSSLMATAVPEPASLALIVIALAGFRRRQ